MSADKIYKKLRLFVASPKDVAAERGRLHAVVEELNRTGLLADTFGITLEVLDWQTHVAPLMGRPEDVVLQQLPVDTWDIFVGLLWLRFGTPSGASDPQTGKPFDSGTAEEFSMAYNTWNKNGRPKILFYRCTRVPANLDDIDPDQHKLVKDFFSKFKAGADHPDLPQSFQTTEDFERRVRQDLTRLIMEFAKEVLYKALPRHVDKTKPDAPKVFISYAWENQLVAKQLQSDILRDGVEVFVDYEKIIGGDSLPARISAALEWCNTLVLLWSSNAAQSYYVSKEWESAFHLQKRIIPCVLDDTLLPALLRSQVYLNFSSYDLGYTELCRAIGISPFIIAPSKFNRFFNHIEKNAEYIFISGGTYKYSITGEIVQVPELYFAKYPVTNKLYNLFIESFSKDKRYKHRFYYANDERFNDGDQPVVGVSWHDAVAYCEWLTEHKKANGKEQKEKAIFCLPKEEEWEWAASGGKRKYPWGNEAPNGTRANYGRKVKHTTPVISYPAGATPQGLMDLAGNVWEWMENRYENDQYARYVAVRGTIPQTAGVAPLVVSAVPPVPIGKESAFVWCAASLDLGTLPI